MYLIPEPPPPRNVAAAVDGTELVALLHVPEVEPPVQRRHAELLVSWFCHVKRSVGICAHIYVWIRAGKE